MHAGKLSAKAAEELVRTSKDKRSSFVASVIAAGAVSPADLAHTLAAALALPLLDLAAVDMQRLPRNIIDGKLASQYQIVVLGKRGNRIFVGGADPTDQEAVERIKFATQLSPEWVIVEHDKLAKVLEGDRRQRQRDDGVAVVRRLRIRRHRRRHGRRRTRPRSRPRSRTRRSCASCRRC